MSQLDFRNAIIRKVTLGPEDHGILTAFVQLDYGSSVQGFGGYNLGAAGANYCAEFIKRTLAVVGAASWEELPGKPCRVQCSRISIIAIGNLLEDRWFTPGDELKAMQEKAEATKT